MQLQRLSDSHRLSCSTTSKPVCCIKPLTKHTKQKPLQPAQCAVSEAAALTSPAASNSRTNVSINVARSPLELGGIGRLTQIAKLLGSAFYMADQGKDATRSTWEQFLSMAYGWQLTAQLVWMHLCYSDSTVSVIALADPEPNQLEEQVVGTAVVQLKVTGKELQDACSCDTGLPVLILSNVAVSESWRGRGIGRRIMQVANEVAVDIFSRPPDTNSFAAINAAAIEAERETEAALKGIDTKEVQPEPLFTSVASLVWDDDIDHKHPTTTSTSAVTAAMPDLSSMLQQHSYHDTDSSMISEMSSSQSSDSQAIQSHSTLNKGSWAWWQTQAPVFMALVVYKYNDPAIRLYRSCGWREATAWKDKVWEAEAERGKPGSRPRRLLYIKPLPNSTPDSVLTRLQ